MKYRITDKLRKDFSEFLSSPSLESGHNLYQKKTNPFIIVSIADFYVEFVAFVCVLSFLCTIFYVSFVNLVGVLTFLYTIIIFVCVLLFLSTIRDFCVRFVTFEHNYQFCVRFVIFEYIS